MPDLPLDLYRIVLSNVSRKSLLQCRLVNSTIGSIATELAFHHIRLEVGEKTAAFVSIAGSPALRELVREITVDSSFKVGYGSGQYSGNPEPMLQFVEALLYLIYFRNLNTLHIRFNSSCGDHGRRPFSRVSEDDAYRFCVLDPLFKCLAGQLIEQDLRDVYDFFLIRAGAASTGSIVVNEDWVALRFAALPLAEVGKGAAIKLRKLTVCNLADYDDAKLTSSRAFKQVLSSAGLEELKILVTKENGSPYFSSTSSSVRLPAGWDFFEALPRTWLPPTLAQNLRVLSLYSRTNWGWAPKMDFRAVNPGKDINAGLPNLRVLALGNYVFTHDWQVDWIASLGLNNGRGGLEELYLDDCPIMWQGRTIGPLDDSFAVYTSPAGEIIKHSNAGYPRKDIMTHWIYREADAEKFLYHLRWDQVLKKWAESMKSLKVFKMGTGDWDGTYPYIIDDRGVEAQKDSIFMNYDCQSPPTDLGDDNDPYRFGVGLEQKREQILQYVHFDIGVGPAPWFHTDDRRVVMEEHGLEAYEVGRRLDEEALTDFLRAIARRNS